MEIKQPINEETMSKRQKILNAAYEIFSNKGYYRATIDEIVALAETGKGTVYNYFSNKEELFYTLVKEHSEPFHIALQGIESAQLPCLEKIAAMIKTFLKFYVDNADLWRVLMHEMRGFGKDGFSHFTEDQRQKYREEFQITIAMLEKVLQEGMEQGVIKKCDSSKAAYGLFSVIVMMVFQKFAEQDLDETAANIADIFLYGVAMENINKSAEN